MKTLLTTIFCFLLTGLAAQGQTVLETTADEVVVTGSRITRLAEETTQRVTVIDSATVARAADLSQLLNEQAGIHINGAWSNPGKDRSVFLRNGANQYTVILVDGQPLIDPSSLGGAVDLRLLDLSGVDRIEILRGGQSVLYGSDAVAGVINLVTRENTASTSPTVHLRAAAQSYGTLEGGVSVSGATATLSYRAGVGYFTTNGLSEAEAPAGSTETFGKDGADRLNASVGLNWKLATGLSIRPSLRIASFDGEYDNGSFQDGDNSYTNDLILPGLAADYTRGDWTYAGRYNFAGTDRVFNAAFPFEGIGRAHQGEFFVVRNPGNGTTLTAGVQVRDESLRLNDAMLEDPNMTTVSPYVQYTNATVSNLLVDLGARYNQHSEFGGQFNASVGVGYRFTPEFSARLSSATAYQSPTLDQLAGPFGPNPDLEPQVSNSIELSTRLSDAEDRYRVTLSVFSRSIDNLVVYASSTEFPFGRYENQGELADLGVELEGRVTLSDAFALNGNFTYVKGEQTSPDGMGGTVSNDEFFRRPRTTGTIGLTYAPTTPLLLRLSGLYTGERPDIFFDENFMAFTPQLDPYFLLNVYAEYKLLERQNLTLFAEVRNLTDTDFVEVTGFTTQGITGRGGVMFSF